MTLLNTPRSDGRDRIRFALRPRNAPGFGGLALTGWSRLLAAWRQRHDRRHWQRDLLALDDRLLRDIGITRADAEQAIRRSARQRPGFWI